MALKVRSLVGSLQSFRPKVAGVTAIGFLAFFAPVAGHAAASCEQLSTMREQLREVNAAIASAQTEKVIENQPKFDAEEQGCISNYMPRTGLGLPGFADLLDGLVDAACSAADSYLGSQLSQLSVSLTGPLDLVGLDLGIGNDGNFTITQRDVGVDYGSIMNDIKDKLPKLDNDLSVDLDYSGGQRAGDYYLDQGRGSTIDYNPSAGGRR